jgi:hypothetical protein
MNFYRLRQPLAVWLALLIAVFGALAPTLSLATSGSRANAQAMLEICSSGGQHEVSFDIAAHDPSGPASGTFVRICPLCLNAVDRVSPPPSVVFVDFTVVGATVVLLVRHTFHFIAVPARVPISDILNS